MIRSALLGRRLIQTRTALGSQQQAHFACCFFSGETAVSKETRSSAQDQVVNATAEETNDEAIKRPTKFIPFFQEVDNLSDKSERLNVFFQTLGKPYDNKTVTPAPSLPSSSTPSIFDAFPIPDAPLEKDEIPENAYKQKAFAQYKEMITEIFNDSKFRRVHTKKPLSDDFLAPIQTWLQAPQPTVEYNLPLLTSSIQEGVGSHKDEFERQLEEQREAFLKIVPLTKQQYKQATVALYLIATMCAKRATSVPLKVAWEKLKEAGIKFDQSALNTILYSSTGHVRSGSSLFYGDSVLDMLTMPTTTKEGSEEKVNVEQEEEEEVNLVEQVATFHDLLYEPTEESVTIRIRALVAKGNASGAEALLDQFSRDDARQRTFLPILRCYLERGDFSSGLRLFRQMRESPLCILESETYIKLLSSLVEQGFFSNDSDPIEGAMELGFSAPCGPKLFDDIVGEMAEDVLEISSASARRLFAAFEKFLRKQDSEREIVEIHPLAPLPIDSELAADNEVIVSRVLVSDENGICPRSGAKLRLIQLTDDEREQTRNSLLKLAASAYEEWNEKWGRKVEGDDRALVNLGRFAEWLDTREGEPFTAFMDGPNCGYFMQNFERGKFNWYQTEFMLRVLEDMGETPLVIMPQKYCLPSFTTSGSGSARQTLCDAEMAIIERLSKEGKLYRVPSGFLDDYYWMLASVSDQTVARAGRNIDVHPDDESGRWPGMRPMLVSNDQMRDHKLELLEPRLFRRWHSCHIVNYNFTAFVDDECVDKEISFSTADFFSREIQGNPTSNGDGSYCGTAWHFPVSDWEMHERLCLRFPSKESS